MKQSFRKSLRLSKRKSGRISVQAERVASPKQKKKHLSFRSLRNLTSAFGSDTDLQQPKKKIVLRKARYQTICFFRAGSKQEEVRFETTVACKVAKSAGGTLKTFKKASKQNATVGVGDGRLSISMQDQVFYFEINHIDNLHLASPKAKEVLLTFKGDDQIFFLKCESATTAQSLVREIFLEIRRVCFALNKIVESVLPEGFRNSHLVEEFQKMPLDEKTTAELVLRELVDLTLFSRGPSDMAFVDSADLLGFFLKSVQAQEEGNYWMGLAQTALQSLQVKLERDGEGPKRHILQDIRNPLKLSVQTEMKGLSVPTNSVSLIERIQQGISHSAKALRRKEL